MTTTDYDADELRLIDDLKSRMSPDMRERFQRRLDGSQRRLESANRDAERRTNAFFLAMVMAMVAASIGIRIFEIVTAK